MAMPAAPPEFIDDDEGELLTIALCEVETKLCEEEADEDGEPDAEWERELVELLVRLRDTVCEEVIPDAEAITTSTDVIRSKIEAIPKCVIMTLRC